MLLSTDLQIRSFDPQQVFFDLRYSGLYSAIILDDFGGIEYFDFLDASPPQLHAILAGKTWSLIGPSRVVDLKSSIEDNQVSVLLSSWFGAAFGFCDPNDGFAVVFGDSEFWDGASKKGHPFLRVERQSQAFEAYLNRVQEPYLTKGRKIREASYFLRSQ